MTKATVSAVTPRLLVLTSPAAATGVPAIADPDSAYSPTVGDVVLVEQVDRELYVIRRA